MLIKLAQNRSIISSKICPEHSHEIGRFLPIVFQQSLPQNSPEISQFFCEFALKIPRNLVFFRDLLEALVICFCGPDGAQHSITFLSFWSY